MSAGYSGTPLARKLGMKPGHRVATFGAPDGFEALLEPLPEGVVIAADPEGGAARDVLVAFVPDAEALAPRWAAARPLLDPHGGLWIAWPKQSSPLATEFRESDVRKHGLAAGLVDNKVCAVDEDWSGLRFVVRKEDRPGKSR